MWIWQIQAWAQDHDTTLPAIAAAGGFPVTVTWRRSGRQTTQRLRLAWGPVGRYGACRPYLACPACSRKCFALYLPGNAAEGQPFACRTCWKLVYAIQQERPSPLMAGITAQVALAHGADPAALARELDTRRMFGGRNFDTWLERRRNVFDQGRK